MEHFSYKRSTLWVTIEQPAGDLLRCFVRTLISRLYNFVQKVKVPDHESCVSRYREPDSKG
jgi:hypothetical protein